MKVLIADDEEYTREGIVESIRWEEFGIEEVLQAKDGAEAEQITKWFHPDLVITDIRMPKLDGIGFAERLLQAAPKSKIIFISGYMEIDYYKSAIQMSAVDYIEKPIDIATLERAIKRAVDSISEVRQREAALRLGEIYKENRLFFSLTQKDMAEISSDKDKERLMGHQQSAICMICNGADTEKAIQQLKAEGFQAVVNRIEATRAEFILVYKKSEEYRIAPLIRKLIDANEDLVIARGMTVDRYQDISASYETAKIAMNRAFYKPMERYFLEEQVLTPKAVMDPKGYSEFCGLLTQEPAGLVTWFKDLFETLNQNPYYSKKQVCSLFTSLIVAIDSKYCVICNTDSTGDKEQYVANEISLLKSIEELSEYTFALLDKVLESHRTSEGYSRVTRGVIDYVGHHYFEPELSVSEIADYMHMSGPYLNVLFKQEMKCTLKQYISNYRIAKAKEMLEQGFDKINEIALACGYANGNYFAKVFKESTNLTPQEYRRDFEKDR